MGDVLYEPVVRTCKEVVFRGRKYFYYEDDHNIAQTAATALQVPQ